MCSSCWLAERHSSRARGTSGWSTAAAQPYTHMLRVYVFVQRPRAAAVLGFAASVWAVVDACGEVHTHPALRYLQFELDHHARQSTLPSTLLHPDSPVVIVGAAALEGRHG